MTSNQTPVQHPLLSAHNLTRKVASNVLLDNINVQVFAGEVLGIIGPNGAGKSTLLKILAGVATYDEGQLKLVATPFAACSANSKARILAYLEQRPHVYWPLAVKQVVALGRLPHTNSTALMNANAIESALAFTGSSKLQDRLFHTLSEGEKMLVNLSRVLATEPQLILADEPTAALDPYHQLLVLELFRKLSQQGLGIILVLHDLQLAARFCDRLVLLHQGKMVSEGSPTSVLSTTNLAQSYRINASYDSAVGTVTVLGRL